MAASQAPHGRTAVTASGEQCDTLTSQKRAESAALTGRPLLAVSSTSPAAVRLPLLGRMEQNPDEHFKESYMSFILR